MLKVINLYQVLKYDLLLRSINNISFMKKQLKQPSKYTHSFLNKKASESEEEQAEPDSNKSRPIQKQKYVRKVIKKPHEPSAIRLGQINKTFEKLSAKSQQYVQHLSIDKELLGRLVNLQEKFLCECKRNVKFYCLKCNSRCKLLELPPLELPMQVQIVHHLTERINKSSIAPMRFLTKNMSFFPFKGKTQGNLNQEQNKINVFDKLPAPSPQTYILYPHKNSKPMSQIKTKINNLIILDCTWFQTDSILTNLQQGGYKNFIKLEGYQSVFWRYNHFGDEALSSAESLMFFFREYQSQLEGPADQYDSLMLLYALSMQMIAKSIPE